MEKGTIVRPGPGQESVWHYPRPPVLRPDARVVQVILEGEVIASSSRSLKVLETAHPPTFYLPPQDVRMGYLNPSGRTSRCEFKGEAVYFHVEVGSRRARNAAWSYPEPAARYSAIAGYVVFYAHLMDLCTVGGVAVVPQPGGFYGGWITPEVVGPFKGEPGTEAW